MPRSTRVHKREEIDSGEESSDLDDGYIATIVRHNHECKVRNNINHFLWISNAYVMARETDSKASIKSVVDTANRTLLMYRRDIRFDGFERAITDQGDIIHDGYTADDERYEDNHIDSLAHRPRQDQKVTSANEENDIQPTTKYTKPRIRRIVF